MRVATRYSDLPAEAKGAVVAIGNFDGVHPGHRAVLTRASEVAETLGAPLGAAMAALTAEAFIERGLLDGLGVRHIVVGAGFAFGKGRTGTVSVLEHVAGHKGGAGVTVVAPVSATDGALASSSRVR